MRCGVILVPDGPEAEKFVSYSNSFTELAPTIMTLEHNQRPPHITLLHVEGDEAAITRLWSSAQAISLPSEIRLSGLKMANLVAEPLYSPEGGVVFSLECTPRGALRAAHDFVLKTANELGLKPLGAVGERFSPHVTLGILERAPVGEIPLPADVIQSTFAPNLVLGRLGEHGTFPEILMRATASRSHHL